MELLLVCSVAYQTYVVSVDFVESSDVGAFLRSPNTGYTVRITRSCLRIAPLGVEVHRETALVGTCPSVRVGNNIECSRSTLVEATFAIVHQMIKASAAGGQETCSQFVEALPFGKGIGVVGKIIVSIIGNERLESVTAGHKEPVPFVGYQHKSVYVCAGGNFDTGKAVFESKGNFVDTICTLDEIQPFGLSGCAPVAAMCTPVVARRSKGVVEFCAVVNAPVGIGSGKVLGNGVSVDGAVAVSSVNCYSAILQQTVESVPRLVKPATSVIACVAEVEVVCPLVEGMYCVGSSFDS